MCVAYALWKWEAATSLVQALDSFSIVRERETFPALRPPPLRLVAAPATVADCSYLHRPYRHERTRLTDLVRAHLASSRLASPRFVSPCVASFRPLHGAHSKLSAPWSTPCPFPVIIVVQCFQIHDTAVRGFVLREDFANVNNLDINQCTSLLYYESKQWSAFDWRASLVLLVQPRLEQCECN